MNKRIQDLISQCAETFTQYVDGRGNITETYFNKEKFAELIIKECAKIADEGFGSAHFGLGISGKMLKDHFGIKG